MTAPTLKQPTIVRIWRGRTPRDRADEYEAYNYEAGIKPLIKKALGVQTLREDRGERNRVHDHLLLGERRGHEKIHRRRSQKDSSSRPRRGIPDRAAERGADPAPPQEPWHNRLFGSPLAER